MSVRRTLISWTIMGSVAAGYVFGADHGWWGDQPVTCQGPQAETTALHVTTAASIGRREGEWLRKLNGPAPTREQMFHLADQVAEGTAAYLLAFQAAAKNHEQPEYVKRYEAKRHLAKEKQLAQHISLCSPCPQYAPDGQTLTTVAARPASGEALARAALSAAGFRGQSLEQAVAIAKAESGFDPTAANPKSSARGLMQIMLSAHQDDPEITQWRDPYANARMAYRISRGGTDWSPWSTWPAVRRGLGGAQLVDAKSYTCTLAPSTYRTGAGEAWGGYENGRIPAGALTHPASAPAALFRPDASVAFDRLSAAYAARFGRPLGVTDSYRSYSQQVTTKARKRHLAAEPGTSNHGWGLAADVVCGGYSDPRYLWMRANAPAFGWDNPAWARPGGSKAEPWHWEYNPTGAAA